VLIPFGAVSAKSPFPPERLALLSAAAMAATAVLTAGLVLAARRFTVGFAATPAPFVLVAAATAGAALVLFSDMAARACGTGFGPLSGWRLAARIGLAIGLAALVIPPPLATLADVAACLASVAITLTAVLLPRLDRPPARSAPPLSPPSERAALAEPVLVMPARTMPMAEPFPLTAVVAGSPGHVVQRFERVLLDGNDCLRGRLSILVPQGARTGQGHVAFCPPFGQMPLVDVTTDYDGVEAVVTAAEVVPWGVRVECRLDDPAEEPFEIPVDLLARSPA
jgi:hypothetical protein